MANYDEFEKNRCPYISFENEEQFEALLAQGQQTLQAKGCQVYLVKDAAEAAVILQRLCQPGERVLRTMAPEMQEIQLDQILTAQQLAWQCSNFEEIIAGYHRHLVQKHPLQADLAGLDQEDLLIALQQQLALDCSAEQYLSAASQWVKQQADRAQWGITGANAILTDTGTIVLAENQGDGRLVSNIPAQHIALVGLEKLYDNGNVALQAIRAAYQAGLAQSTPVYYSLITGPSRTGDIEGNIVCGMHGPLAVHVILLDNGRRQLMAQGHGKLLHCLDCGSCHDSLQILAEANHWPETLLTCKNIALCKIRKELPDTMGTAQMLPFSCPAKITPADLAAVLETSDE